MKEKVIELFKQQFVTEPDFIVRSPGRVNLIGEHTDYNDGFVFPMALEQATWLACRARDDDQIVIYSRHHQQRHSVALTNLQKKDSTWVEYIKGVAHEIKQHYKTDLKGFDAVVTSDLPMGAGLSSSASFELAIAKALCQCNSITWQAADFAKHCQQAENNWMGVNCGIMDQLICAVGQKDHAVMLDCRDLSFKAAPLPRNILVVILDTSTRRGLVESAYNERRSQCEQAAKVLGIKALRDINLAELKKHQASLDAVVYQRAHHVVSENERVQAAFAAMQQQDAKQLGELLKQSHQSLDSDYAVTNLALNQIVDCANQHPACFGARMTGAGFGGCAVALVKADDIDNFIQTVSENYTKQSNLKASIYVTKATAGCECC